MLKFRPQGDVIIEWLRHGWMTYGEMQRLGVSTSPQKRVCERLEQRPELELLKVRGEDGLIRWRVAKRRV
jgi:hypothetical protein